MVYCNEMESRLRSGKRFYGSSNNGEDIFMAQKGVIKRISGMRSTQTCSNYFTKYQISTLFSLKISLIYVYGMMIIKE